MAISSLGWRSRILLRVSLILLQRCVVSLGMVGSDASMNTMAGPRTRGVVDVGPARDGICRSREAPVKGMRLIYECRGGVVAATLIGKIFERG